jgi:hypothetical protein
MHRHYHNFAKKSPTAIKRLSPIYTHSPPLSTPLQEHLFHMPLTPTAVCHYPQRRAALLVPFQNAYIFAHGRTRSRSAIKQPNSCVLSLYGRRYPTKTIDLGLVSKQQRHEQRKMGIAKPERQGVGREADDVGRNAKMDSRWAGTQA